GTTTEAMVEYVDVVPTFVEAAGSEPDANLDGESFLPVLLGEKDDHKEYVYGIMTTRGIINGSETFGIRSVRSGQYKLIVNLTPEIEFTNACTQSDEFLSWVAKAKAGDGEAAVKVKRYSWRPAVELYDVQKDPLELENLADNPEYAGEVKKLRAKLDAWMLSQGDEGQATEAAAHLHQGRNRKKADDVDGGEKKKKKKKNNETA
ncbi:MAG: sulfatase/phosphatase domain-containing protein, partial [Verrucomicrobiota bacterium]